MAIFHSVVRPNNLQIFPFSLNPDINFEKIDSIIELGAGTGIFTEHILKKAKKWTKIICFEIQDNYIKILQKRFPNQIIIEKEDVKNIDQIKQKYWIKKIDLIISWLPFKPAYSIHKEIKDYISEGTIFRSFTYQPRTFEKQYNDLPIQKKWFTLLNIPPARVYGIN